jgi:hypothetical protein
MPNSHYMAICLPKTLDLPRELKDYTLASFIYGQLIYESGLKKLGASFEHFGLVVWPKLLINARTLMSGY